MNDDQMFSTSGPEEGAVGVASCPPEAARDLAAPDVTADPYAYFGRLRETDPVHWHPRAGCWIVTRYEDVAWIVREPARFSSAIATPERRPAYPPVRQRDGRGYDAFWDLVGDQLIVRDRPSHRAMRATVHRLFAPRAVERLRAEVRALAGEAIERRRAEGAMELRRDLAMPLPLAVICDLLGVPRADAPAIRRLAEGFNRGYGIAPDRMRDAVLALRDLEAYLEPLVRARARDPREDLISMLAAAERDGALTRREVIANAILLLDAGHETLASLVCNGVVAFAAHPRQWDLLRADPDGLAAAATEECLRYEPPAKGFWRVCAEDVELHGRRIRAGERVFWCISSANRDPRAFADPDRFDVRRSPNPHLAFGGGVHHCLGAALARVEAQEIFKALAAALPRLVVTDEPVAWVPSLQTRTPRAVHVCW